MNEMKIVVIGGTGLIGTKLVNILCQRGHEVLAASPSSGVNTLTREGLSDALKGAQVAVDASNAPSWEDKAVLEFFQTSARNLLAAEAAAGQADCGTSQREGKRWLRQAGASIAAKLAELRALSGSWIDLRKKRRVAHRRSFTSSALNPCCTSGICPGCSAQLQDDARTCIASPTPMCSRPSYNR